MTAMKQHGATQHSCSMSVEPVFQVLQRAASEAAALAADLTQLDHEIGRVLDKVEGMNIDGLQCADSVRQGLEGLSQFLVALSDSVDPEITCDPSKAASGLGMQAQAQRLVPCLGISSAGQKSNPEVW